MSCWIHESHWGGRSNMRYDDADLTDDLFVPDPMKELEAEAIANPEVTFWRESFRRLLKNRGAVIGLITITLVSLLSIFGPMMNKYAFDGQDLTRSRSEERRVGKM